MEEEELEDIYEDDELSEMEGEELELLSTCASSCQSSTVNSALLSFSGAQSRNTCGNTVIIHLRQTF